MHNQAAENRVLHIIADLLVPTLVRGDLEALVGFVQRLHKGVGVIIAKLDFKRRSPGLCGLLDEGHQCQFHVVEDLLAPRGFLGGGEGLPPEGDAQLGAVEELDEAFELVELGFFAQLVSLRFCAGQAAGSFPGESGRRKKSKDSKNQNQKKAKESRKER